MARKFIIYFLVFFLFSTIISASAQTTFPTGFISETVVANLAGPTTIAFANDGRIFIGQKDGKVRVFENGVLLPTLFIDLTNEVNNYWDRGLLGIALHPDFPTTPYVYLLYTYDPPEAVDDGTGARVARLMRVSANPNNTNVYLPGSEVILLGTNSTYQNIGNPNSSGNPNPASCYQNNAHIQDCIAADSPTHTIGTVTFGIDGSLLVSSGDGAHFNTVDVRALRSLDLTSLNGKILRINPITGEGYPNNPFYNGDPNSNQSKVYSYGLRNPFRTTVHPSTGEIYIGDVGWGTWEEINTGLGKNFGWPCYEGRDGGISRQSGSYKNNAQTSATCAALYNQGLSAVQAPLYAYDHSNGSSSVQAGSFYLGDAYPSEYHSALFFADYNGDWIRYLTNVNSTATKFDFGLDVTPNAQSGPSGGIVQLIAGPDTNLYYVTYYGPTLNTSEVRRIRYVAGGNTPPTANANADVTSGYIPLTVNFSSDGTYDPDADLLTYEWDFGDGNTASGENVSHTYTTSGEYIATLTVADPSNTTSTDTVTITIGNLEPVASISSPANGTTYSVDDVISFSGTGVDNEDGNLSGSSLKWSVLLHHNDHIHFDFAPNLTGNNGSFETPDHGDNTWMELCLTVTDSGNLSDQECISLIPNITETTFNTSPTNLSIWYNGEEHITPHTIYTVTNSVRDVSAPLTQGECWDFVSWSHGQTASHQLLINQNQTLTANYVSSCPVVLSINRADLNPNGAQTVNFTVTFSEPVTGVNASDFSLTTNLSGASISQVSGSGSIYQVSVTTGSGNDTLELNLVDNDSIKDSQNNPLGGAGNNNGNFTSEIYNIIKTTPNSAPNLTLPRANSQTNNALPTFSWGQVSTAIGYEIYIATDNSFNNIVLYQYLNTTSFTPTTNLPDGTYYWKVRGFNGRFSPSRKLVIDTTPPAIPNLTSPMDGATLTSTPTFRWTPSAGAVLYEVQFSTDNFTSIYRQNTVRSAGQRLAALPKGSFSWRVRAKDALGNWSDWSTIRTFTIQ
ncbi:MAG: PQQ-dependent sugar dehydrogenase [Anaerolineales bacterium]|nr:PQQ-dependent sugar dehydrogenase [Anaerolineales bacterium]